MKGVYTMSEPIFNWDEEEGVATCILSDSKNNVFTGIAYCCDEDEEFKSEKTGCEIALARAEIKLFTHIRDNELKPQLSALKHFHACIQQSKEFSQNSYENKALCREIHRLENLLDTANDELAGVKESLKEYIEGKERFHKLLKERRNKDKLN